MNKLLIKGGTVVFSDRCEECDLLIEGKKIVEIAKNVAAELNLSIKVYNKKQVVLQNHLFHCSKKYSLDNKVCISVCCIINNQCGSYSTWRYKICLDKRRETQQ